MTAIILCIRFLHINRNQRKRIYIYRKRFSLRNWLTELCRLANPESAGWARSGDFRKRQCCSSSAKAVCWRIHCCAGIFRSIQSFNSLDETYPYYSLQFALLKVRQFRVNLIQNHTHRINQNNNWQKSGHCGPTKVTQS